MRTRTMAAVFVSACAAAAAALGALAAAEDAPADPSRRAAMDLLVMEASHAEQYAGMRFAFTLDFSQTQNGQEAAFTVSYDPRREKGAQWALEGTSLDALDDHARKAFESLQASKRGDDGIVYDRLGENLTQDNLDRFVLESETATEAVFVGPLIGGDAPEGVLTMAITFDKTRDYISRLDVRMVDAFKPTPMVKVKSLEQSQFFSPPADENAPALLRLSENVTTGDAMFRKFSSDTRLAYSDIRVVEVPDPSAGD